MKNFHPGPDVWREEWTKIKIDISYTQLARREEIRIWCDEHDSDSLYYMAQFHVGFSNPEDATIFALKWITEGLKW